MSKLVSLKRKGLLNTTNQMPIKSNSTLLVNNYIIFVLARAASEVNGMQEIR
jgi:hypothetical protein